MNVREHVDYRLVVENAITCACHRVGYTFETEFRGVRSQNGSLGTRKSLALSLNPRII